MKLDARGGNIRSAELRRSYETQEPGQIVMPRSRKTTPSRRLSFSGSWHPPLSSMALFRA
jgi:hypothetical protein